MDLLIWPGMNRMYRLVLAGPGDSFETLSEHDTPDEAVRAKRDAERAALSAFVDLGRIRA